MPFTGGASSAGVIGGIGLTVGAITISTAELAIIFGGAIALKGIDKGYNVKFNSDGSVELTGKE